MGRVCRISITILLVAIASLVSHKLFSQGKSKITGTVIDSVAGIHDHWNPRIAAELNGQHVKLVKFQGEFVWHHHEAEDELFLVVRGQFRMDYRDASGADNRCTSVKGEFVVVPAAPSIALSLTRKWRCCL